MPLREIECQVKYPAGPKFDGRDRTPLKLGGDEYLRGGKVSSIVSRKQQGFFFQFWPKVRAPTLTFLNNSKVVNLTCPTSRTEQFNVPVGAREPHFMAAKRFF